MIRQVAGEERVAEIARMLSGRSDEVALEWGRIAAIRPRNMADALIAATAAVHRKTVVTRNVADFADLGVPLIDPWNFREGPRG